jgi:hypothetical protein
VRELGPDDVGVSVSYPLPGTRFHERVKAGLGEKRNWEQSDDLDPLLPGQYPPDFYQVLARTVHAELRVRRGVRALRAAVADPLGLDRTRVRAILEPAPRGDLAGRRIAAGPRNETLGLGAKTALVLHSLYSSRTSGKD